MPEGLVLFGTAFGRCGLAWSAAGVTALAWPEREERVVAARLRALRPGAVAASPPPRIRAVTEAVAALLGEGTAELAGAPLDLDGVPAFHRRVYEVALTIPPGRTLAYGEIATRLGSPGAARAVGQALGRNPFPIIVPCHRILTADGRIGGFSAPGGTLSKHRLLDIERSRSGAAPALFEL
ncbi:cysteine methyltransferase [Amycolatopsis antarctica]|uniref:methylated-DNA--[protein]-cysteine S-methyltransferase n=1 Tax=Amycolatopsis antarctica TaxID=1854586 RepID=A0A263DCV6_9PSEU|nr:cysteine methyltransferase [Amycolatopsis antarctica]